MNKSISPGEIAPGIFVTVLEWLTLKETEDFNGSSTVTLVTSSDNSWKGDVLEVLAVQLPFIVVKDGFSKFPLDTRKVRLMELKSEYVEAAKGK